MDILIFGLALREVPKGMDKQTSKGIENLESTKRAEDIAVTSESVEEYSDLIDESETTAAETCRSGTDEF
jgi:hypothetical protein